MPCHDQLADEDDRVAHAESRFLKAAVCALMRAVESGSREEIDAINRRCDWPRAGIDPALLMEWYKAHQRTDLISDVFAHHRWSVKFYNIS